jgi:crossover junction endodeoxyribonuclease RusA
MTELRLTIPLVPPLLNHYVRHTRNGRHYVTKDAKAYKQAVSLLLGGRHVCGQAFEVEIRVYLGKGKRGDADGFSKVVIDGVAEAGALRRFDNPETRLSDAHIMRQTCEKFRDWENPRTEVIVRAI